MISKKLGLAALAAAASLAPSTFAATSGPLASLNITVHDLVVDGQCATKTVNLAGDSVMWVSTCSGQVRKTIVGEGDTAIVSTASYDASGRLLSSRDATGAGTDYTYDALGRKLTETDVAIAGKVRRYAYDVVGHLIAVTDPLGITTTYAYDARDRKISDSTPMSANEVRTIRYGFDGRGNMITLTDANGAVTAWGFDAAGRQISKRYANGDARSMAYDAAGRLVKLTDENGKDTVSVFDLAGRLLSKAFSADNTTDTYAYDAASRMTSVTKGRYNHTLSYGYDAAGRVATETHPDGTVLHLAYDVANRLTNLSLADSINSQPSTDNYNAAYGYDGRGLLSNVTSGDYATRYDYRANGQLLSTINSQLSTPQGDILRADRSYDAGARLIEVANTAANGEQVGVRYTLSADDQRVEALEETGQKWQYGYDGLKQLVTAKKTDTATSVVPPLDQSYSYDPMGNRRTYTEQGKSIGYTTNSANQYTSVESVRMPDSSVEPIMAYEIEGKYYVLDGAKTKLIPAPGSTGKEIPLVGQWNQGYFMWDAGLIYLEYDMVSWVPHAPLPQVLDFSESSPVYDRNGNMLSDGVKNYTWDAENQLIAVTPVNPSEGSQRVEYTYDWRMRRKDKKSFVYANGAWALARTHTFKYHEWNPIEETITSTASINSQPSTVTSTKSYVWGNDLAGNLHGAGGVGGLLSMKVVGSTNSQPSTDNYFYAYDGNGNVRALVKADAASPAASAVVEKYAYDGFGRELAGSGSINSQLPSINSFRFSTKYLESEAQMNYYGYRYYAADAGRWINRDLIEEDGGLNIYAMIGNNPVVSYDVNGLNSVVAGGINPAYGAALAETLSEGAVVVGTGAIATTLTSNSECPKRKRCKPCDPGVGTKMYRSDRVKPPRLGHYVPSTGKREPIHTHHYTVEQTSVEHGCRCSSKEGEATAGITPATGEVPEKPVTGGGVEEY